MITNSLLNRIARFKKRGGFTLVELLVVIAIIAILAGVALGPITNGIKQAKHNTAMQSARTVGQLCFNYATDNTTGGNKYPCTGASCKASDIAQLLVTSGYASDGSVFIVSGQNGVSAATSATFTSANVSWAFTLDVGGSTGIQNCGDSIPVVYFDNQPGSSAPFTFPATAYTAKDGTVSSTSPQGTEGVAVYYKGNNASYIKSKTSAGLCPGIIPAYNTDSATYSIAP